MQRELVFGKDIPPGYPDKAAIKRKGEGGIVASGAEAFDWI